MAGFLIIASSITGERGGHHHCCMLHACLVDGVFSSNGALTLGSWSVKGEAVQVGEVEKVSVADVRKDALIASRAFLWFSTVGTAHGRVLPRK
jgi:hypothetical protein